MPTATVTYKAEGPPDTTLSFELAGANINDIHRKLALKKKELDEKFNVDPLKTVLIWTISSSKSRANDWKRNQIGPPI